MRNSRILDRFLLPALLLVIWPGPAVLAGQSSGLADRAQSIIEQRCVVCHGCYDAPCQLKLEARAGLERGGSKIQVYDGTRLRPAETSRLFDDVESPDQWRDKSFFPVTDPERPEAGLMYRLLELKQAHPLPVSGAMPQGFDFSLSREQQCPKPDEFDQYAKDFPLWGMPYGLPGLTSAEHDTMLAWLEAGAPSAKVKGPGPVLTRAVSDWETFLNGDSDKERLMSRYLYEHLFLASLYLDDSARPLWYRLVRSKTPPGEPIDLIATRRPFDDPGTNEFYYRLQHMPVTPLMKIHMPYRFDGARRTRYRELFLTPNYEVGDLPDFDPKTTGNPFKTFKAIPATSRYRFLLDEAQFTVMNFIKGPVCRGQIALNVIEDHFWVMFASPDVLDAEQDSAFLAREADNLRLPTVRTGTPIDLVTWLGYARREQRYQQARADYMHDRLQGQSVQLDLEAIWDGDGHNPNAALTIFRHFDSASVEQGFLGNVPKTAWVVGYPLLERIHYLLAANFDVYGPVSHQLESRLYMDFLRIEGESNFLLFMPQEERVHLREHWYRDTPALVRRFMSETHTLSKSEVAISYRSQDAKSEFLLAQKGRIHGAADHRWNYDHDSSAGKILRQLENDYGAHNAFLPQVSYLNLIGDNRDEVYSIVRNSGYANIAQMFREEKRRIPEEDGLTVVKGFLGAYPNYFFQVHEKELPRFAKHIAAMSSEADYDLLLDRWGIHRTDPWFWSLSDKFHRRINAEQPIRGGLLDLSRYHARYDPDAADSDESLLERIIPD